MARTEHEKEVRKAQKRRYRERQRANPESLAACREKWSKWQKTYRKTERGRVCANNQRKRKQRKQVDGLQECYIRGIMASSMKVKPAQVPAELITMKRAHLALKRELWSHRPKYTEHTEQENP